jgi:hypothetical protein
MTSIMSLVTHKECRSNCLGTIIICEQLGFQDVQGSDGVRESEWNQRRTY